MSIFQQIYIDVLSFQSATQVTADLTEGGGSLHCWGATN